jgi:hypothetical protein
MSRSRFFLIVLCLAAPALAAQSQASRLVQAEGNLRRDEASRFAAMVAKDTAALGRYLAEELAYTHSNALFETRSDHLAAIATGRTVYEAIGPVEMAYRMVGDLYIGAGIVTSKGSIGGTPFDVRLRVTTVHVERNGRWQLVAWQSTRLP